MTGCPIKRIITFKEAVIYGPIKILNDFDVNITSECQFSWSTDGACWTSWVGYLQYTKIAKNLDNDYFLRVLITGGLGKIYYNNVLTDCYTICFDQSNVFLKDFCEGSNLFQPYNNLDCALQLQQQTADSIICMFGIPIYYLRVTPNQESVDYTFKEWTLHNVVDIKQLKLMIPDGQMPSSNPKLTDFDFDWEIDWETELSKSHFAKAFGDTAFPKQRDLIYVPLMKRLWEVNSAYDEKNEGLLWRPTTWKLSLVKYNDKTNIDKGDFEDLIDGWMVNKYEETIGEKERIEQERESGSPQLSSPRFSATNLYDIFMEDAIRKQVTKQDITIQDKLYCHHNTVTARNIYRFKNDNACVVYQNTLCGPSGWLSFIIETPGSFPDVEEKDILNFGEIRVNTEFIGGRFCISWGEMSVDLDPFSVYMVLLKWSGNNKTVDFIVYPYKHKEDLPLYLLKPEMYWWDFENPVIHLVGDFGDCFSSSFFIQGDDKKYNEDWTIEGPCQIQPYPLSMTNIKYYRGYMSDEDIFKECVKYTTNHEQCVINDLARPFTDGHGYAVK